MAANIRQVIDSTDLKDIDLNNKSPNSSDNGSTADIEDDAQYELRFTKKKLRKKRKKIYHRSDFVDGESESSSDESDDGTVRKGTYDDVNPADLDWLMWMWFYIWFISTRTLHAAEFCGEKLADFFGITAPKYQYAINEYYRLQEEEEEEQRALEREEESVRQRDAERILLLEKGQRKQQEEA